MVHAGCTSGRTATGSGSCGLGVGFGLPIRLLFALTRRMSIATFVLMWPALSGRRFAKASGRSLANTPGRHPFTPPREIHTLTSVDLIIKFVAHGL